MKPIPLETIVSFDIEATGPAAPPRWSMISLGAVAFRIADGEELGRFSVNLKELPGSERHPDTMDFWDEFPEAFEAATENPQDPGKAMLAFERFFDKFPGARLLASPVAYDGTWLRWYMETFRPRIDTRKFPPWHSMIDMRSAVWAATGEYAGNYRKTISRITGQGLPPRDRSLRHLAVEDAFGQGWYFLALARWLRDTGRQIPSCDPREITPSPGAAPPAFSRRLPSQRSKRSESR